MRPPRDLTPEDRALWQRIVRHAAPLARPAPPPTMSRSEPLPKPAPGWPAPAVPRPPVANFRVGEAAVPMAVPPPVRDPRPPLRMDAKVHRRMVQGKLRPEAKLDLHGMTLAEAHPALIDFVDRARASGLRLVLVITGKGRGDHGPLPTRPGALRHQLPIWLGRPPLAAAIQQVAAAHLRHGGDGAFYVYLRR